jgi:hypothetical protein
LGWKTKHNKYNSYYNYFNKDNKVAVKTVNYEISQWIYIVWHALLPLFKGFYTEMPDDGPYED